jgi:hypothetical protein
MKKILLAALSILPFFVSAQFVTFWTEDFGSGCGSGTYADGYFSPMTGAWSVTDTGPLADTPNNWFISAEENGNAVGACGTGCGNNRTLHLSADQTIVGTDLGAAYFEGLAGFCDLFGCGGTDRRVESPVINCSGIANIILDFKYIEGGNAIDNATLWYFDGSAWSQIADMPKTPVCPNGQGEWTAFSIALPASSNNNTNVRIGFRWINNDDGDASDPSFAVDDIELNGDFATDAVPPVVVCPPNTTVFTEDFCAIMSDYILLTEVTDDVDPFPLVTQTPEVGTDLVPGFYTVIIEATDVAGNSSSCSFEVTVIDDDAPVLTCIPTVNATAPTDQTGVFVNVPIPDVLENCGDYTLVNDFNGSDNASGFYPIGTTTVTFTATDETGNSSSCDTQVVVQQGVIDCCLGDFDCDGFIGVLDLLFLLQDFGCTGGGCSADLDGNDIVGVTDLQIFNGVYGTVCN